MKQSPDYQSLARLTAIQHLRSQGIKIKHWNCKQRPEAARGQPSGKLFGTALHVLPQTYVQDYGAIPSFLVDMCKYLELHSHTEGLFRKSGSIMRQKLLKTKLDSGDSGLSDAQPCDVAGILKQFFRELPEPILPADLHDALFKAQHLACNEDRVSATILISCLIPERSLNILRYIFSFLHTVSLRSDANRMDSNNLAVVFAPNLLQSNDDNEKMSASTEKKLRTQTAVVRTLIDHSTDIGCVPHFLLEKIPGMLGVDIGAGTPGQDVTEDSDGDPLAEKKRRRRSVGGLGSMVTPLILTPSTKRKLPVDSAQGFSTKKRKSIKHSLAFELLPNSLFGSGSTPASACFESPHTSLETSQSSLSPSVSSGQHLSGSRTLRRSKRCEIRKVQRVDSGKTGCFSPKISRKERVRRSLRLRFSLGKSSKDVSQNIGWRLANSQELTPMAATSKAEPLSFPVDSPFVSAGSKHISKSEENLLSPPPSEQRHRKSWTGPQLLGETPDEDTPVAGHLWAAHCYSEPVLVSGKPPAMPKVQRSLAEVYRQEHSKSDSLCEEELHLVDNTVMKITKAFTESGTDLHRVVAGDVSPCIRLEDEESVSDLVVGVVETGRTEPEKVESEIERVGESPATCCGDGLLKEHVGSRLFVEEIVLDLPQDVGETLPCSTASKLYSTEWQSETGLLSADAETPACSPQECCPIKRKSIRVSDHIQHFNKLCLSDSAPAQKVKSPLKLQRTPVRQSVRRINSLSEVAKQGSSKRQTPAGVPMMKSVSFDGSHSSDLSFARPVRTMLPRRCEASVSSEQVTNVEARSRQSCEQSVRYRAHTMSNPIKSVLEDLTNQDMPKNASKRPPVPGRTANNCAALKVSGREHHRYKGSPRNPIGRMNFLPSSKPLEL
uniref:Rho-GAP domain-containing protein n=1 Tax=Leptobrachium leishanense TaxID=445787 RepID=A0A8C5QTV8_9ANUR